MLYYNIILFLWRCIFRSSYHKDSSYATNLFHICRWKVIYSLLLYWNLSSIYILLKFYHIAYLLIFRLNPAMVNIFMLILLNPAMVNLFMLWLSDIYCGPYEKMLLKHLLYDYERQNRFDCENSQLYIIYYMLYIVCLWATK